MGFRNFVNGKELVKRAKEFATAKHKGQFRKFGNEPYINHPLAVSNIVADLVAKRGGDYVMEAAAILHDTLEDTDTSLEEIEKLFGVDVAKLVSELTTPDSVAKKDKAAFLSNKMVLMSGDGLVIKLVDRLHNVSDLKSASPQFASRYAKETKQIIDYLEDNRTLSLIQKSLTTSIKSAIEPFLV